MTTNRSSRRLRRRRGSNRLAPRAFGLAGRLYLEWVWRTTRMEHVGPTLLDGTDADCPPPHLGAFWHSRLLYFAWAFSGPSYGTLVSRHRDGELIAVCLRAFGTRCVRGSTRREGGLGLRRAARLIGEGVSFGITPDGPLGPARRAQPGAVSLASRSGAPLVPVAWAVRRRIVLSSWDGFLLPLPFNRGVRVVGEPLRVPPDLVAADREFWRRALEVRLDEVTDEADRRAGAAGGRW